MRNGWLLIGFVVGVLLVAGGAYALGSGEPVSGEVPLNANNGPNVTIAGASEIELTDPFIDANTVDVATDGGNATLSSSGDTNVTIQNSELEGPWTNLTELDVSGTTLTVDPDDKPEFTVEGGATKLNVSDTIAVADGSPDFVIDGSGTATVTVTTGAINERLFAVDASGTLLADAQSDASGTVTFSGMSLSKHVVSIRQGTGPRLSALEPQGLQQSNPTQVAVQVNDTEFSSGDTVQVNLSVDGSLVSTQTISQNQTVTASMPSRGQTAGQHTVEANATDNGGSGDSTKIDGTYQIPSDLFIRNETSPNQNITGVNVTVTSFGEDTVTRNFSGTNAVINLTGLPADRPLLIRMENDSFYDRTTLLDNVFETQRVYLLNKTFAKNDVRFLIDDRSGVYPADSSQILINRVLDVNGSTQFERISGDFAAVDGHTAKIIDGKRHQIIVRNEQGDTRVLGGYDSEVDETVELTIGEVTIEPGDGQSFISNASYDNASKAVQFAYVDSADATSEVEVVIYERGNRSNEVLNQIYQGPFGEFQVTQSVPSDVDVWVVEYEVVRNGRTVTGTHIVGPQANLGTGLSDFWQSLVGVVGLVVVAGLFGGIRAELGAIAVPLIAGALFFVGWLPASVGAGAVLLALLIGVIYYTSSSRGAPAR